MCGIYGITEKNYNIVSDCIKISSHRGPDGLSIWMNDKITLGHNLLSITSAPSEGKQPWITDRQNILVYNGEIFNYYEIKKKMVDSLPIVKKKTKTFSERQNVFQYEIYRNLFWDENS